ncbi:MAG: NADH-quinone oxidoreductase subunit NuoK [Verrucomicrobiia bacterium]|jgi:NADH-quinone oxidoreductase subunit K
MNELTGYIVLSGIIFSIGFAGVLLRKNAIIMLAGIELMLAAANLNFITFWRANWQGDDITGAIFVLFTIAVAAAEAAVGFALVLAIFRHYKSSEAQDYNSLKG